MKSFFFMVFFVAAAIAQRATIGLPAENQKINSGEEVVIQVQRPNSLSSSKEMGVAIGLSSCESAPCRDADEVLGTILYNGPFKPEYHESSLPPYENFTVTVPASATLGKSQINIAHAALIGAGPSAFLESLNQTVYVV
ncbi:hypothetical protein E8E15_004511 [Penicillium rubens]|uniref:Pc18g03640 protein n=2 Tax=Penicillium chrysogenum species complex TaxID=254878 RepID=B6HBD0_PENRW|nr:uncharacterized protein N7525_000632 [Penicillium rubens]KZN92074.1 hypothetical protein EN45_022200 [Penicillium chrysogenum]CAP94588.1 Pc18g03640 [Penicillium rubens Wisconsin 54-1255]KAF3020382.1 hypothetical protein E8E15_004511 [Penicillium rubens]KAJ5039641.1 hypothetical protein NUH16_009426 [Penicillium rubens]KAJ5842891.1 hypothetical protein N7525_000632 [Penicillium rubens]